MLFSDCVNSDMAYLSILPILPRYDSSSWTDFTFLLTPAIRRATSFLPGTIFGSRAPAPVVSVATEGNLRNPRLSTQHGQHCPSQGRGWCQGPEGRQGPRGPAGAQRPGSLRREHLTHHLLVSPDPKFCTTWGAPLQVCGWPRSKGGQPRGLALFF